MTDEPYCVKGARRLAAEPTERTNDLINFVNFWGLDSYTPPQHVEDMVRDVVNAFIADAWQAALDGANASKPS